jgi:hypothetical protein
MGLPTRPAPGGLHRALPRIWPYSDKIKSDPAGKKYSAGLIRRIRNFVA